MQTFKAQMTKHAIIAEKNQVYTQKLTETIKEYI